VYYQGGQEYDKDDNDPDRWSLFEIKGILKEDCHVEGKYRIWWYRNSDDRYISIVDDNDAYEVVKYASEMNTQVEIFVDHSCKGIAASNPIPIPDPIPAPNQSTRQANVDDTTVNDGNDDEGGGEHDNDDSSYYGSDSSEDEAAGIHFDDSEDERALGLDDGFGIELEEQPIPLQICDVGSKKKRRKTVANRNTPKKSNVSDNNEDLGVDDDIVMEQKYDSEELNSSDPDVSDGEKAPKYDKFRMEELHKDYEFKVGLEFASLQEFKTAIRDWTIMNQRQNKYLKNDKVRVRIGCRGNCGFLAFASKVGNKQTYRLKTYSGPHTCPRVTNNKTANSKWISKTVAKRMATSDNVKLREIVHEIRSTYSVGITMNRAWRGKKIAKEIVDGDAAKQYSLLWRYSEELRRVNEGNTCKINVNRIGSTIVPRFGSFYFSLDGIKKGFVTTCRPFIGVDGCHLKTKYGGTLLIAVGRDPNDQYFPLAFGVCETETKESWRWFLTLLMEDIGQEKRWVFISDQQKV
jgi:hypothetical protein